MNTRYYPKTVWIDSEAKLFERFGTPSLDAYMTDYRSIWQKMNLNSAYGSYVDEVVPTEMTYELKPNNTHQHQFRMAHLKRSNQAPVREWCREQFGSQGHGRRWRLVGHDEYHFMFDKDAMHFRLRFGSVTNQDFDDENE